VRKKGKEGDKTHGNQTERGTARRKRTRKKEALGRRVVVFIL
jgi:hypothetical protein